jgi:hypothetical protein
MSNLNSQMRQTQPRAGTFHSPTKIKPKTKFQGIFEQSRCVKPNAEKEPFKFQGKIVMEQLLFSGAMEAVKIRRAGFPMRLPFDEFSQKFMCILPKRVKDEVRAKCGVKLMNDRPSLEALIQHLPDIVGEGVVPADFALGKLKNSYSLFPKFLFP